jgi:phage terminase large subunit
MQGYNVVIGERYMPLFDFKPHNAIFGGRGTGKSVAVVKVLVPTAATQPKKIICGRQYQTSIAESSKAQIEEEIYNLGANEQFKITKTAITSKAGATFSFIGLDINPDSMKSIAGTDILWVEEAASVKKTVFQKIIPTFLRKPKSSLIWTWNPEFSTDAVDEYYRGPNCPENSFVLKTTQDDNPFFQQTELYEQYSHDQKYHPNFGHIWLGQYNENSDARIFSKVFSGHKDTRGLSPLYGLDFGFSKDPNAMVKVYINHAERWIYIPEAIYFNCPLIDMPEFMNTVSGAMDSVIVGDSSRPETIDFLNSQGFSVIGAIKGAGSVKSGISFMQGYDIFVAPDLEDMDTELIRYQWVTDKKGRILNTPVDKYNHMIDAARYALEREMYNRLEDGDDGITKIRRLA